VFHSQVNQADVGTVIQLASNGFKFPFEATEVLISFNVDDRFLAAIIRKRYGWVERQWHPVRQVFVDVFLDFIN
jgi:hypothetical protein